MSRAAARIDLAALQAEYKAGASPSDRIVRVLDRIEETGLRPAWISLVPRDRVLARALSLDNADRAALPLYGVPFALKDNIDVAGMETTAGCPEFAYEANRSATVVERLEAAGAILIGKTNMDQFATGLVGVRSPYGACSSVFDDRYIAGGSSSGSAVAVARGLVSFALGTDTAGSGRVPAAFNNIVGLKPTRGSLSARGVVPACRSLDCVSIFAATCADAAAVFDVARGHDPEDAYGDPQASQDGAVPWLRSTHRIGIPAVGQREFFGDVVASELYERAIEESAQGGELVEFDLEPFLETAGLLYAGPWVAERFAALETFIADHGNAMHPVVREIVLGATRYSAIDAFRGEYRLQELVRQTATILSQFDFMVLPTTGTIYTIEQIEADPVALNSSLGRYTNFVNLLDLCAVAVPAGFRSGGLPFGVSLIGPRKTERGLLVIADSLHRRLGNMVGAGLADLAELPEMPMPPVSPGCVSVAVVGAHLTGQPLNWQLTSRSARLELTTRTTPDYRLYALAGTKPPKPGLVRDPGFTDGVGIEVEVWSMPSDQFGGFVAEIPSPLGIGTLRLAGGLSVKGFVCEPYAIHGALEITQFGGWRNYLSVTGG